MMNKKIPIKVGFYNLQKIHNANCSISDLFIQALIFFANGYTCMQNFTLYAVKHPAPIIFCKCGVVEESAYMNGT